MTYFLDKPQINNNLTKKSKKWTKTLKDNNLVFQCNFSRLHAPSQSGIWRSYDKSRAKFSPWMNCKQQYHVF